MTVTFKFDFDRAVAAILYLASRPEEQVTALDKYKVSKLLFLADKYHLVQYGRPILGDFYKALPLGPVPQITLNGIQSVLDEGSKGSFAKQLMERLSGMLDVPGSRANRPRDPVRRKGRVSSPDPAESDNARQTRPARVPCPGWPIPRRKAAVSPVP